ncbi:MAG: 2'-5' RNA ligase family protein [Bacteroidota bacterium]
MSLLVLAYPSIEKKDYDWLQSVRAKYDERYFNIVEPHFTIVFPVFDIDEKVFIKHVEKITKNIKTFYFVLRCSQVVKDSFSDYYDVFLIPEEGYRIFVKLHDSLYTGILEKELRIDIPFIPHLGIGNNKDPFACKNFADDINIKGIEIVGAINKLDIVSYTNDRVTLLHQVFLD